MTSKIDEVQKKTIEDVEDKLKHHNRCLLVRPTGFGKTKIAIDIAKKYKNTIFLYPTKHIGITVRNSTNTLHNFHLFTYAKLRNLYKAPNEFIDTFKNFDSNESIFILDEVHCIGATNTSEAITNLIKELCPNANYLGLTATPCRTDKSEIKWHYFNGYTAFEYTLSDAFKDGIFMKPYYIFTSLNGDKLKNSFMRRINKLPVSYLKKEKLKFRVNEFINPQKLNIENLDEIIQNNLEKFKNDMDYYKFILFFTTFNDIHVKQKEIVSAFKKIFPHCNINVMIITSENYLFHENIKKLDTLKPRENTIDLILNVNMLTFGYHVSDITGIMMFRSTVSNIIYTQQVGRCLSVNQRRPAIIFDFVENYKKDIPDYIPEFKTSNKEQIFQIDLLFPKDDIVLDDETKELLEIDRLIKNAITEEFEEEVVKAYKLGIVEIEYCIMKLQLSDSEDFMKVLERYEYAS